MLTSLSKRSDRSEPLIANLGRYGPKAENIWAKIGDNFFLSKKVRHNATSVCAPFKIMV